MGKTARPQTPPARHPRAKRRILRGDGAKIRAAVVFPTARTQTCEIFATVPPYATARRGWLTSPRKIYYKRMNFALLFCSNEAVGVAARWLAWRRDGWCGGKKRVEILRHTHSDSVSRKSPHRTYPNLRNFRKRSPIRDCAQGLVNITAGNILQKDEFCVTILQQRGGWCGDGAKIRAAVVFPTNLTQTCEIFAIVPPYATACRGLVTRRLFY